MKKQRRQHKKVILQQNSRGQYTVTVPIWLVEKVLVAKKGDLIECDFKGGEVILRKIKK